MSISFIGQLTAVPEKDQNVGIFFGVDDSACASPDNDNDDIYASDCAVSPFEMTPNDSDTLIGEPLSGRWTKDSITLVTNSKVDIELIFVNTDPQTVEKSLGIKSTTKKKGIITDTNDENGGPAKQAHTENKKKKKWPSMPGVLPFTSLVYFTDIECYF